MSEAAICGVAIGRSQSACAPSSRSCSSTSSPSRSISSSTRPRRPTSCRAASSRAARPPDAGRRGPARRGTALAEPRSVADARSRPEGRDAEHGSGRGGTALASAIADPNPVVTLRVTRPSTFAVRRSPRGPVGGSARTRALYGGCRQHNDGEILGASCFERVTTLVSHLRLS